MASKIKQKKFEQFREDYLRISAKTFLGDDQILSTLLIMMHILWEVIKFGILIFQITQKLFICILLKIKIK